MADKLGDKSDPIQELRSRLQAETTDSIKLLANPEDNPICSISIDDTVPAIVVVWRQYATSTQLRFIHEYLLDLLKKNSITKILGDDTELATIHSDDQIWITENWMPRAMALGLKAAASKTSTHYFGRQCIGDIFSVAPTGITLRSFNDTTSARQWLKSF